jgi:ABC-type Zn uptake system ZnuABC Zn-binding protein ZnuA
MAAVMTATIAEELAKRDPPGAETYRRNAKAYAERLNRLSDELSALGQRMKNTRIVAQHGAFDYLARDMGLEIVAVMQAHAGQEPSAAEMLEIVATIRAKQAGAVFTEPQYPPKTAATIAQEAGVATTTLDPVATGPENAGLDYYEKTMRENMKNLQTVLGTK